MPQPPPVSPTPSVLTRDPVRVLWVLNFITGGVVSALLAGQVIEGVTAGVITGVATVVSTGVALLFVQPNTVAVAPLQQLADAAANRPD